MEPAGCDSSPAPPACTAQPGAAPGAQLAAPAEAQPTGGCGNPSLVAQHSLLVLPCAPTPASRHGAAAAAGAGAALAGAHDPAAAAAAPTMQRPTPPTPAALTPSHLRALPFAVASQLGAVFGAQADACMRCGDPASAAALYGSSIAVLEPAMAAGDGNGEDGGGAVHAEVRGGEGHHPGLHVVCAVFSDCPMAKVGGPNTRHNRHSSLDDSFPILTLPETPLKWGRGHSARPLPRPPQHTHSHTHRFPAGAAHAVCVHQQAGGPALQGAGGGKQLGAVFVRA